LSGPRRIIFTQQNEYQNWTPLLARLRLKLYFLLFFPFIDSYTCVSEKVRDSLCALSGKKKYNFSIIPNSVNTGLFFPDETERKQQRAMMKFDDETFVAGVVARFSPQKGHHYLIDAARILKKKQTGGKILLIGVGDLENEIRELVSRYSLDDYVMFYGQALAVHQVLQTLDCFILPSLWEGMPLALLEAMASGIPVVATDVAGTREVIKHGVNGLLIPPRDPEAIAEAFKQMKDHTTLREELAQRALNFVRETYSVDANMVAYIKLYEY
jgi:glycosyltransferase involved in cell wall biosynthesis